jgi:hypothetical protein
MAHDHAHGHAVHDHKGDARAAFMGLIFGAITLLVMCYIIVQLTNKKFEGHSAAAPASTSTPAAPH